MNGSWKGDNSNPSPNNTQEAINRSEQYIGENRAHQTRRDTDTQRDFTISLYDIDETILSHLEQLQFQVEDVGKQIKVPIIYGSAERWTSANRDGYVRDKQGKLILPLMMLKRTSSENDSELNFFNRYLNTPAIKLYSEKNKYTQFSILTNGVHNAPINEVYNVVVPSHMVLKYHFIIWTEYVEQMNKLVEKIRFNTGDYWGSSKGFRFRTKVDTYSHTIEIETGTDRVVKTEFDLETHGYILPDTIQLLEKRRMTFQKMFTPKKIIMGIEVVATAYNLAQLDKNRQKWQSQYYPNIQADVPIEPPPLAIDSTIREVYSIPSEIIVLNELYMFNGFWHDDLIWKDNLIWADIFMSTDTRP